MGGYEECNGSLGSVVGPPAGGDRRSCWNGCTRERGLRLHAAGIVIKAPLVMSLFSDQSSSFMTLVNPVLCPCNLQLLLNNRGTRKRTRQAFSDTFVVSSVGIFLLRKGKIGRQKQVPGS